MSEQEPTQVDEIARKISILVREKGWNQDKFATATGLNRQTVRKILLLDDADYRLRNSTIAACAGALNLKVHELRNLPIERLLLKIHNQQPVANEDERLRLILDQVSSADLRVWIERNPERSRQLSIEDWQELLEMQGPDGVLARFGVEHFVQVIERRRDLVQRVKAIADDGTYLDMLEPIVDLIYEKIHQPSSPSF